MAFNVGMEIYESDVDIEFIGINPKAIKKGEIEHIKKLCKKLQWTSKVNICL